MLDSGIYTDLDFDRPGRQIGSLKLAHSNDRYCFGIIPIPIAVLSNGEGPTLLLTAGNHGDEYDGQVVLRRLIHELDPDLIRGRIIIIPALNYPAVTNESRVSPLDGANLNRSFPGDPRTPTGAIAHYLDAAIFPLCDAGIDFHSGGKSAEYLPSTFLSTHPDRELMKQLLGLVDAFGAPYTLVFNGTTMPSSLDVHAQSQHNIPFIATEAGGTGTVNPTIVQMNTDGIYRILKHLDIIDCHPKLSEPETTRFMTMGEVSCFLEVPIAGLFEPYCQLGDSVEAGQPAGCVYSIDAPERPMVEMVFDTPGLIVGSRNSSIVERGMFAYNIGTKIQRDDVLQFGVKD